jgi:general secretion pathway protein G
MPQSTHRPNRREAGFSLIEIMAVVVIIGLLIALVGSNIRGSLSQAEAAAAKTQIGLLENSIEEYRMDNRRYPTTEQGLEALVQRPTTAPEPLRYKPGGYLRRSKVPEDPWGQPYQYLSPGQNNPHSFDVWSWGSDGAPGGTGDAADIGNWES